MRLLSFVGNTLSNLFSGLYSDVFFLTIEPDVKMIQNVYFFLSVMFLPGKDNSSLKTDKRSLNLTSQFYLITPLKETKHLLYASTMPREKLL